MSIGSVKVLGSGCEKCNALEKATKEALEELGMNVQIDHVTDFAKIAAYGVMTTPALVVDEKTGKTSRVGLVINADGGKTRVARALKNKEIK